MQEQQNPPIISAHEIANYAVCPEAWALKLTSRTSPQNSKNRETAKALRKAWKEEQELSKELGHYARITYALLSGIVALVFVLQHYKDKFLKGLHYKVDLNVPDELLMLLLFVGMLIFIWDLMHKKSRSIKKQGGLSETSSLEAVKSSESLPTKLYISKTLGLSAEPDAVISENKKLIPVLIKPNSKKVRDRHVLEILTCLRLLAEEGERPAYGLLILGEEKRQVKINFSEEKERWHESLLEEMRSILEGVPAVASPAPFKCRHCDVEQLCKYSAKRGL